MPFKAFSFSTASHPGFFWGFWIPCATKSLQSSIILGKWIRDCSCSFEKSQGVHKILVHIWSPPTNKKNPNQAKLCEIKSSKLTLFPGWGGGNAVLWTNDFVDIWAFLINECYSYSTRWNSQRVLINHRNQLQLQLLTSVELMNHYSYRIRPFLN